MNGRTKTGKENKNELQSIGSRGEPMSWKDICTEKKKYSHSFIESMMPVTSSSRIPYNYYENIGSVFLPVDSTGVWHVFGAETLPQNQGITIIPYDRARL